MNDPEHFDVVVVDDEVSMVEIVSAFLRRLSLEPKGATQAARGLSLIQGAPALEFVVCDVVMPGMTGPEVIERAAPGRETPLRVLFISGYDLTALRERTFDNVVHHCLKKPFSVASFTRAVETLRALPVD